MYLVYFVSIARSKSDQFFKVVKFNVGFTQVVPTVGGEGVGEGAILLIYLRLILRQRVIFICEVSSIKSYSLTYMQVNTLSKVFLFFCFSHWWVM